MTSISINGSNNDSKLILGSENASITSDLSSEPVVLPGETISDFYNARAGVVSCPWYNGNGPCTVQIRLALPHQFDLSSIGGMSDASFQALQKEQLLGFIGCYSNTNLGTELGCSQTVYRSDISGKSVYMYLCFYPSVADAAYYWLVASSDGGFNGGPIFGSAFGTYNASGELNPQYDENSVEENYFSFTGLTADQIAWFKGIGLNKTNSFWYTMYDPSKNTLFRFPEAAGMTNDNKPIEGFYRPEISRTGVIENIKGMNASAPYSNGVTPQQAYPTSSELTNGYLADYGGGPVVPIGTPFYDTFTNSDKVLPLSLTDFEKLSLNLNA